MRILEEIGDITLPLSPTSDFYSEERYLDSKFFFSWLLDCHGLWYNIALIIPSFLFVVFLLSHARKSFTKLAHGRSYIMISYYGLLWLVSVLNLAWSLLQAWQCTPGKELAWNILSLFTASGMLFLEISLLAFLLQGNHASGLEALTRTFVISGIILGADLLLKAIYLFGFGVPLFIDDDETNRIKWGLWVVHKLLLTAVYGIIFFMHHTRWRDKLPARPAFYNYICMMFLLNAIALFACVLIGNGAGFGFWLYNLTTICYHSLYLPFLYVIFLADFFEEEDLHLENVFYSEMKDAGFFDADWD
ncbi:protein CANDIDATE G-PROTEIN COUPLED RECEPTOR 2-like [Tasmannia lanceolata]|uniref:protein CANDIDATE G-PROTEIN COUPLED RECEPTOR 2-like n=1 Tax=Tasmannia lanceolata TaxID=3420 RepID=UPI0040635DAC